MKKNMSSTDRVIRLVVAAVVGILIYQNVLTGTLAVILGVLAGVFVLTSILGVCPLYMLFKISTKKSAK